MRLLLGDSGFLGSRISSTCLKGAYIQCLRVNRVNDGSLGGKTCVILCGILISRDFLGGGQERKKKITFILNIDT